MASEQQAAIQVRMPRPLKDFVDREAKRTFSSINSQIVQAIAERKERLEREREQA